MVHDEELVDQHGSTVSFTKNVTGNEVTVAVFVRHLG